MTEPTAMDIDQVPSTATENSSTGEASKRLKMTMDDDDNSVEPSPLVAVLDPSKEPPNRDTQLDNKDVPGTVSPHPTAPSTGVISQAPESSNAEATLESQDVDKDTLQSNHEDSAGQELARALIAVDPTPSANDLNDSILAIASLSEPLKTTLEMLEDEETVPPKTKDPITSAINAQPSPISSGNIPSSESQDPANSNPRAPDEIQQPVLVVSKATHLEDAGGKDDLKAPNSESLSVGQDTVIQPSDQQQTSAEKPILEQNASVGSQPGSTESSTKDISAPQPADASKVPARESEAVSEGVSQEHNQDGALPTTKDLHPGGNDINQKISPIESLGAQVQPASSQQQSSGTSFSTSRTPPFQPLPPLSTISATQPSSEASQNSARPSRSSMSLSALLVSNDDDSEQDPDHGRAMSRSIFGQFEAPSPSTGASKPSHPPTQTATTLQSIPPAHAPSTISQTSQSSGQTSVSSTSPRSGSGGTGLHRIRDSAETSSLHSNQPGYSRPATEISHASGRGQEPARATAGKDYPGDEVMESGGVGGYGTPRYRLASPVGVRPVQDSVNGAGGGAANNKLPGVGSMTGPAPAHDPHSHPNAAFRNEASHPPLSTRPNQYSSSQHPTMTHPTNTNGHYPPSAHSSHPSAPSAGPTQPSANVPSTISHHPKLVVKNDASLAMDGRPELFLGYFRYEPALLLPNMEGKENSLLEVRIASPYLTYDNVKVKRRELWGTEIYTDDSDVVAMLIHTGLYIPPIGEHNGDQDPIQPDSQQHNFAAHPLKHVCPNFDLAVTLRVMPKLVKYQGSIRNRIKSRTWNNGHDGQSLRIESIQKLCSGEALNRGRSQSKRRMKEYNQERLRVLSNIHDETTESLQNERAMRTATFEFTHQGDPCFKYSPELVMDRHDGLSRKWTSWRLKKEVLILENDEERYEISLQHQAGTDARRFDQYRFAVISPRTSLSSWSKATYPLDPAGLTEVLYEDLDWQDFEWVERGVVVQPSQRTKHHTARTGSGSSMDGILSGNNDKHATPMISSSGSSDPMAMDVEDGVVKNASQDRALKSKTGVGSQGTLEVHQDGVFCVVSRLSWRPRSEQRSARPTGTGALLNVENKVTKGAEPPSTTESLSHHGSKASIPTALGSNPSLDQVGLSDGSFGPESDEKQNTLPMISHVTNGGQRDAPEGGSTTLDTQRPTFGSAATPMQLPESTKPASSTMAENAMDVDIAGTKAIPAPSTSPESGQQQQEKVEVGNANPAETKVPGTVSESTNLEREEGELEDGEIASD
ncbi:hypothetical protein B0O80DRAFT_498222 [Mortierella sp. GBAus27b]|nr:hypothetical protein B0O80DRAFT_498222 [Mortierella sp. GBAus27b]